MRRISSTSTFYVKRIFLVIWAGALLCIVADQLVRGSPAGPFFLFLIGPVLMVEKKRSKRLLKLMILSIIKGSTSTSPVMAVYQTGEKSS